VNKNKNLKERDSESAHDGSGSGEGVKERKGGYNMSFGIFRRDFIAETVPVETILLCLQTMTYPSIGPTHCAGRCRYQA